MEIPIIVAGRVAVMTLLLFVGWLLFKTKMINNEGAKQMSNIAMYIATPAVIINAYQVDFTPSLALNLVFMGALAFGAHFVGILFAHIFFRKSKPGYKIKRFSAVFANCAFMGFPVIQATIGSDGIIYGTVFITVFNLMVWTYGVALCGNGKKEISPRKLILSPVILSVFIGLFLFVFSVRLPGIVGSAVSYIADLNTPLAMLVTGAFIAGSNLKKVFLKIHIYWVAALRLLIIPACMLPFIFLLSEMPSEMLLTLALLSGMPTASVTAMLASKFGLDTADASDTVVIVTLLSVATIPFISYLAILCGA